MTETGTTLTIKPERETLQVEAPDGDEDPAHVRDDWFSGAAPAARSPWKATQKVGMK